MVTYKPSSLELLTYKCSYQSTFCLFGNQDSKNKNHIYADKRKRNKNNINKQKST